MTNPRDILNKIKWKEDPNLDDVQLFYIHRGAPDNTRIISGNDIFNMLQNAT